ncbi:MAG: hypothetical protein AB7Q16_11980 [Vicinamibacterales bacterium]
MGAVRRPFRLLAPSAWLLVACAAALPANLTAQSPPRTSAAPASSTDAEREAFLSSARIVRARSASKGVTNTVRVTLSDGTLTHDASIQTVDERKAIFEGTQGTEIDFKDSWRFNLAAYRIDRLLGLGMIPATVERRYEGKPASFTWWVDDVLMDEQQRYRGKHRAPNTEDWNQQMWITRLFDQLIANADRNLGNLLIDKGWNIWMIDHSRAFRMNTKPRSPGNLSRVERTLLGRLEQLDRDGVREATGSYLTGAEIDALLARRDHIVSHFAKGGPALLFDRPSRCC